MWERMREREARQRGPYQHVSQDRAKEMGKKRKSIQEFHWKRSRGIGGIGIGCLSRDDRCSILPWPTNRSSRLGCSRTRFSARITQRLRVSRGIIQNKKRTNIPKVVESSEPIYIYIMYTLPACVCVCVWVLIAWCGQCCEIVLRKPRQQLTLRFFGNFVPPPAVSARHVDCEVWMFHLMEMQRTNSKNLKT